MQKDGLFTTFQAAKLCSVSRATLLRMEERELVIPSVRESENQPRYYTPTDIARLSQVISLSGMGFSNDQIRQILDPKDFQQGIHDLETNLYYLNRLLEELRGRFDSTHIGQVFEYHVPETYCYCVSEDSTGGFRSSATLMHRAFMEAVEKDCRLDINFPFFLQISRALTGSSGPHEVRRYTACIPIKRTGKEFPGACTIPGSLVLSLAWAGSSREVHRAITSLNEAVTTRGYRIAGPLRVCTYNDHNGESDITDEHEVIRFHLPVERI